MERGPQTTPQDHGIKGIHEDKVKETEVVVGWEEEHVVIETRDVIVII